MPQKRSSRQIANKSKQIKGLIFYVSEVLETRSVEADGFTTRSLTDGAGRTLQTIDQPGKISTITYDASGNIPSVRGVGRVLYMATIVAIPHNPAIKAFYAHLRWNGKESKVAIVACMRKFITLLNLLIKSDQLWENKMST
ncbi:MAG: hypothetical protein KF851_05485 [Pirellulaceae bacterium]|nr:hypothetical protein [Pirellulaceae bacterium]